LLKLPFVQSGINFKAASAFLAGDIQYIEQGEENMFKNIFEILPAHNFKIDLKTKSFQKWSYYSLKANTSFEDYNEKKFEHYRNETESLLVDSIKLRLRSDVPVGSCLSGGIDSSAIVGVIGKLIGGGHKINLGRKLNVFTLAFENTEIDESKWAKHVVDQTHADWNLVSPTGNELLQDFRDLIYAQDIPVCSTGTYGQFRLMRSVKEKGIKVVLDGQGGDELFGGYLSHSLVFWKELLRNFRIGNYLTEISSAGKLSFNLKQGVKSILRQNVIAHLPTAIQQTIYSHYFKQFAYLNRSLVTNYLKAGELQPELVVQNSSCVNEALQKDFTNARLKMYLKYEDRSSMWHSIEARTPFADDHRLTEYVFQIPGTYKIHHGVNKHLLREAMRNYLPKQVKERKDKIGLLTPIDKWMKQIQNPCMDYFDDSLSDFMDVKAIKNNPNTFFNISNHTEGVRVFRMISFALWKKIFNL
jgi:asparagine synthase (glutamine-hydrolysing)